MTIATDYEIQAGKNIRYLGAAHAASGAGYYTVLELHRWLEDLADDASAVGNDFMDITRDTPSDRSTDNIVTLLNGYNIDQAASEHLYNGSIIQGGGTDIWDGVQVYANAGMDMQIHQNGALITPDFWNSIPFGTGLKGLNPDAANGISHRFLIKTRTAGVDIDLRRLITQTRVWGKTFSEFTINGTARGNNTSALTYADDLNNTTASGTVAGWTTIANTEGFQAIDVNNDGTPENYYSQWDRATFTINQFYERMKYLSRQGSAGTLYGLDGEVFRGITHEVQLTTPRTGTFAAQEAVSWTGGTGRMLAINSTTAATKMWIQLLTGVAPTTGLLITGTSTATATSTGAPTEYATPEKGVVPFCGASTGTSLIGSYGFGLQALDLSASDKVFDLTNTLRQAPNYVTFSVNNLVSGDRALVAPLGYRFNYNTLVGGPFQVGETLTFTSPAGTAKLVKLLTSGTTGEMWIGTPLTGSVPAAASGITGGTSLATASVTATPANDINLGQMTLNGALTGAAVTAVVVNGAIPSDTPLTGTIRILRASGFYTRHAYTAWTASTFTIASTDFSTDNAASGANVFVSYFDAASAGANVSFTSIYSADRSLFVRVRNGTGTPKIKTYESGATLGAAGGSATVSRINDE